jgi:uncharacterized membrane protein SirB2
MITFTNFLYFLLFLHLITIAVSIVVTQISFATGYSLDKHIDRSERFTRFNARFWIAILTVLIGVFLIPMPYIFIFAWGAGVFEKENTLQRELESAKK